MTPLVVLERGHHASPGWQGATHGDVVEYDLIGWALHGLEHALRVLGVDVERVPGMGSVGQRQELGEKLILEHRRRYREAPCVYVSGHFNSAGARAVAFAHPKSDMGKAICAVVAEHTPLAADIANPEGHKGQKNAFACIRHLYDTPNGCCGILVEFSAVDNVLGEGSDLNSKAYDIGRQVGEALAVALQAQAMETT